VTGRGEVRGQRGTQPERTALAWQRTALSSAVVAMLLLRAGLSEGAVLDTLAGLCLAALVVLAAVAVRARGGLGRRGGLLLGAAGLVAAAGVLTMAQQLVSTA
jgi:uncharacterized membrane protein YidH (DUF202 family)